MLWRNTFGRQSCGIPVVPNYLRFWLQPKRYGGSNRAKEEVRSRTLLLPAKHIKYLRTIRAHLQDQNTLSTFE